MPNLSKKESSNSEFTEAETANNEDHNSQETANNEEHNTQETANNEEHNTQNTQKTSSTESKLIDFPHTDQELNSTNTNSITPNSKLTSSSESESAVNMESTLNHTPLIETEWIKDLMINSYQRV